MTKLTMQQRWDRLSDDYRDTALDARKNAHLADDWARTVLQFRLTRRLAGPLTRYAERRRAVAVEALATADRMKTCPHNPRNGGTGWKKPPPSTIPLRTKIYITLWIAYLIALLPYSALVAILGLRAYTGIEHFSEDAAILLHTLATVVIWFAACCASALLRDMLSYLVRRVRALVDQCHEQRKTEAGRD